MKFKDFYYEATITHEPSNSNRVILHRPTIADLPKELEGKRLVTVANNDEMYFTFIFKDIEDKYPVGVMTGKFSNPVGVVDNTPINVNTIWEKHYKEFDPGNIFTYKGEVRIHPPFKGYKEYPIDASAYFFTDFENNTSEYTAGKTIADKLVRVK